MLLVFGVLFLQSITAQTGASKIYFDKSGKVTSQASAYYYRTKVDDSGLYKSFYTGTEGVYFEGKILKPSTLDENMNMYAGACTWYYKNGKKKIVTNYTSQGKEDGLSVFYYESGKIWKEIEYKNGVVIGNTKEYDEDGTLNTLLKENFNNNSKDWDLYTSNKSLAEIKDGKLHLQSFTSAGTSRLINGLPLTSEDFTVEATIGIENLKTTGKVGILYGFKDWNNYNFFLISKSGFTVGLVYEGVLSMNVENMFSAEINELKPNTLKLIALGANNIFSINGAIQYKTERTKLFGSKLGVVISGENSAIIDDIIFKQLDARGGSSTVERAAADNNVKATGSGVVISKDGYILTNYHVIEDANKVLIEITDNGNVKAYYAKVIQKDIDNDLAILKIDDASFVPYTEVAYSFVARGDINIGASVFTIGFPYALSGMGKNAKFTNGTISSKTGYNESINSFQTSIPVQPGNSGGPVFNDKGELIGVVYSKIMTADNVSYAIKMSFVKNLMEVLPDSPPYPSKNIEQLTTEEKVSLLTKYVVLIKVQ
jgi:S1-C subfamily serine protease